MAVHGSLSLPADVAAAFAEHPLAAHGFSHRRAEDQAAAILHIEAATDPSVRARRIARLVTAIEAEETGC
jgi:uncharacterized protein YdeI (YjbR/CyaY-like superfamily)